MEIVFWHAWCIHGTKFCQQILAYQRNYEIFGLQPSIAFTPDDSHKMLTYNNNTIVSSYGADEFTWFSQFTQWPFTLKYVHTLFCFLARTCDQYLRVAFKVSRVWNISFDFCFLCSLYPAFFCFHHTSSRALVLQFKTRLMTYRFPLFLLCDDKKKLVWYKNYCYKSTINESAPRNNDLSV